MRSFSQYFAMFITEWPHDERSLFVFGTFLVHELAAIPLLMLLTYLYYYPLEFFEKYKIQKTENPPRKLMNNALLDAVLSHFLSGPILAYISFPIWKSCGLRIDPRLPSLFEILWQLTIFLLINDTIFYWVHRTLHHPWFFKRFHSLHHHFVTPRGISYSYAGFVENIFSNILPVVAGPLLLGTHIFTWWIYLFFIVTESIDTHSGYNFPWSPFKLLPFYFGAEGHDFHHLHQRGNYGMFKFWDKLMGTDKEFEIYKKQELRTDRALQPESMTMSASFVEPKMNSSAVISGYQGDQNLGTTGGYQLPIRVGTPPPPAPHPSASVEDFIPMQRSHSNGEISAGSAITKSNSFTNLASSIHRRFNTLLPSGFQRGEAVGTTISLVASGPIPITRESRSSNQLAPPRIVD